MFPILRIADTGIWRRVLTLSLSVRRGFLGRSTEMLVVLSRMAICFFFFQVKRHRPRVLVTAITQVVSVKVRKTPAQLQMLRFLGAVSTSRRGRRKYRKLVRGAKRCRRSLDDHLRQVIQDERVAALSKTTKEGDLLKVGNIIYRVVSVGVRRFRGVPLGYAKAFSVGAAPAFVPRLSQRICSVSLAKSCVVYSFLSAEELARVQVRQLQQLFSLVDSPVSRTFCEDRIRGWQAWIGGKG